MILSGTRTFSYSAPTTYKRITPLCGCGYILKRIYDLTENPANPLRGARSNPSKRDVYFGTKWANRPGFASMLWAAMIEDGLIESNDGTMKFNAAHSMWRYSNNKSFARAKGHYENGYGYTVRYHLTPKGRGILFDMMARFNKPTPKLNVVGSVAEHDAKKDWAPKVDDWRDDDFLEPGETKDEWMARHGVTPMKAPPTPIERDILEKEAVDCAKLAADYAGENQKLRAEKDNLTARLARLVSRMNAIDCELNTLKMEYDMLKSEFGDITGLGK